MNLKHILFAGAMAFAFASTAQAQVAVPHTFSDGTPAVAAQVNANFSALVDAINELADRVDALENNGGTADVTGVYRLVSTQTELWGETALAGYVAINGYVLAGQLTLHADNSWNLSANEFEHAIEGVGDISYGEEGGEPVRHGHQRLNVQSAPDVVTESGTWTRNGATLTLTIPGEGDIVDFRISVGGDVLLGANLAREFEAGEASGQAGVIVAIKTSNAVLP